MTFDPIAALQLLQRHGVRFVVIGGFAGRLWGSPTMTNDVDICYDRDTGNLERLAAALQELHARLRGVDDDVPFLLDARTIANGQNFTFTTDLGPLDVLGLPAGVKEFSELAVERDNVRPRAGRNRPCMRPRRPHPHEARCGPAEGPR